MANIPKEGLDYFPLEVGVFENDKVIDLIAERKYVGFVIWMKILTLIYKNKGYYYRWGEREPGRLAMKMGMGITSDTVIDTVNTCIEVGLFDKGLYDEHGILSGRGIQRRYADAAKERKYKKAIAEFWLLNDEESRGFSKCAYFESAENKTEINGDKSTINNHKSPINSQNKEEKSKAKERREEKDAPTEPAAQDFSLLEDHETIINQWNAVISDNVEEIGKDQIIKVNSLLNEYDISTIKRVIVKVGLSSFLMGKKGWKADFDWFIEEANFAKVLSGKYDDSAVTDDERVENSTFDVNDFFAKAVEAGMRYESDKK